MQRTYLALVGLGLSATTFHGAVAPLARAEGVFSSQPIDASRFAVLGKPVGEADWSLVVLEQVQPRPLCWEARPDGLIDAALNRFDFTGICNRYIDSNGYSLRVSDEDLASSYRLRLRQVGQELQLQAMSPLETTTLLLGRGSVIRRDRDGFVAITLEPDWQLNRRVFGQKSLSHVYFASASPLAQLIARAGGVSLPSGQSQAGMETPAFASTALASSTLASSTLTGSGDPGSGPIALQVVPFRE